MQDFVILVAAFNTSWLRKSANPGPCTKPASSPISLSGTKACVCWLPCATCWSPKSLLPKCLRSVMLCLETWKEEPFHGRSSRDPALVRMWASSFLTTCQWRGGVWGPGDEVSPWACHLCLGVLSPSQNWHPQKNVSKKEGRKKICA